MSGDGTCKIDKLLIGDKSNRGKGIGQQVINALLEYAFEKLGVHTAELNVYDWNMAGIKCYEKAGFTINPDKTLSTQVNGENRKAINMTIDKEKWRGLRSVRNVL